MCSLGLAFPPAPGDISGRKTQQCHEARGHRCHCPGMDGWALSELPWLSQAPFPHPGEHEFPASTEFTQLLPAITAAGLATADSIQQKSEQSHPLGSQLAAGLGRRGGGTRGTKSPVHRSVFPGKQKENKPQADFNRLTMQMYSGPAGHFCLSPATLMRVPRLPCCCHCSYLGPLITLSPGSLRAEGLVPMAGTTRATAGTKRQTPSPLPFCREGTVQP